MDVINAWLGYVCVCYAAVILKLVKRLCFLDVDVYKIYVFKCPANIQFNSY